VGNTERYSTLYSIRRANSATSWNSSPITTAPNTTRPLGLDNCARDSISFRPDKGPSKTAPDPITQADLIVLRSQKGPSGTILVEPLLALWAASTPQGPIW